MYRENIFEFITDKKSQLLVPKNGGLWSYVKGMLPEIGIKEAKEADGLVTGKINGSLIVTGPNEQQIEIKAVRGEDATRITEDMNNAGIKTYALTGDDLFDEYMLEKRSEGKRSNLKVFNTYDWFDKNALFNKPALCLMTNIGYEERPYIPDQPKIAVNKKYEKTSVRFIDEYFKFYEPEIRSYAGGTEETVKDGVNEFCVEIVYSGKSMKENGLKIEEKVRFSDIALIGEDPKMYGNAICDDFNQIERRKSDPQENSTTTKLLKSWKDRRNKLGEELLELYSSIEKGSKTEDIMGEIADVQYMINLMMVAEKIEPRNVADVMYGRM